MLDLRLKEELISPSKFSSFFPHSCSCKREIEEKESVYTGKTGNKIQRNIYWFNCVHCGTTFLKKSKRDI